MNGYAEDENGCPTCDCLGNLNFLNYSHHLIELDCSVVLCIQVACGEGSYPYTEPGQCCPTCKQNCTDIQCPIPACENTYIPDGDCCPVCKDICDGECPMYKCEEGSHLEYLDNDCCQTCVQNPDCKVVDCVVIDSCPEYTKLQKPCK